MIVLYMAYDAVLSVIDFNLIMSCPHLLWFRQGTLDFVIEL